MSRFQGGRQSADDLAYGEAPQRWDRDRFDSFGRGPPPPPGPRFNEPPRRYEEDFRFQERDTPGRRDVLVQDHVDTRGPQGRTHLEERDRIYQDTFGGADGRRRRTDRELFGEVDPRELANMALTPYQAQAPPPPRGPVRERDIEIDINRRTSRAPEPRPGLLRRQSSLDTYDRRPAPRYGREEEYRIQPYQPVPLPYRRPQDDFGFEQVRHRDAEPESYREVEIKRERSVHRRSGRAKSHKSKASTKAPSTVTSRSSSSSSSSSESFEEIEKEPSLASEKTKVGKKGKTRMPKRLVHRDAIHDLAYPYDEEEDFFVLRVALDKEQIDEVIKISEMYKAGDKKTVYRYEEKIEEPAPAEPEQVREEIYRKEYINPPSNFAPSVAPSHHSSHRSHHSHHTSRHRSRSTRAPSPSSVSTVTRHLSPARTERTRGRSISGGTVFEERKTVIEERGPSRPPTIIAAPPPPSIYAPQPPAGSFFEERRTVVEERAPSHAGTLMVQERVPERSGRDIEAEIHALEAERRALRYEREAQEMQSKAIRIRERPDEEFQLVEYREDRGPREILEIREREKSPPRTVVRVEKDRKGRMALVRSTH